MITQTIEITYNGPNVAPDFSSTELGTTADQSTTRFYAEPQEGDVWDVVFNVPMDYLVPGKLAYPFIRVDADGYAVVPGAIMSRIHDDHVNVHVRITHIDDTVEASAPVNMHVVTLANTPVEASTTGLLMVRGGSWTWQEDVAYEVASFVEYDGLIWRAAEPSQGEPPSEDTEYWVHVGTPGPQGEQGVQGYSISAEQTGEYGLTIHTTDPDGQDVVYQSLRGQQGQQGIQGIQGVQGYSISAEKTGDYGLTISTDDPSGQDVVYNSLRGEQGEQGVQGYSIVAEKVGDYGLKITNENPSSHDVVYESLRGVQGEQGVQGQQGIQGVQGIQGFSISAEKTGEFGLTIESNDPLSEPIVYNSLRGEQGPRGEAFTIDKTYPSVEDMEDDFETTTVTNGHFVVIDTGDVEDEDNGKLYLKTEIEWQYITDLSGMQGLTGPQGPQGETGSTGPRGFSISAEKTGDYGLTIHSNDPSQSDVVYSSLRGEQGVQGVQGVQGIQGVQGFSISATKTGDYGLTISSDDPTAHDVVYSSLRGEQGVQGIQGVQGQTGPRGYSISATQTGDYGLTIHSEDPDEEDVVYDSLRGAQGVQGYSISAEKTGDYGLTITSTDPTAEDVVYESLRGEQGQQGIQGIQGLTGPRGYSISAEKSGDYGLIIQSTDPTAEDVIYASLRGEQGQQGVQGPVGPTGPQGQGLPAGGQADFILKKASDEDYDYEWVAQGTAPVTSVNTKQGAVVLTTSDLVDDVGYEQTDNKITSMGTNPTDTQYPSAKLVKDYTATQVAAKSHVEVSNIGTSTSKISYITVDGTEYALNGGVTSVNGQTGAVSLDIPDDTSDLTNGAGFQTASQVSSAITTAVSAEATARAEDVADEATARTNADDDLDEKIDQEIADRTSAVSTVTTNLSNEVTARTNADTDLGTRITSEATARSTADGELSDAISGEATARASADTSLGDRIDAEATARGLADTSLGGRIDGEITARTSADTALGTRITNEATARNDADLILQGQIDALGNTYEAKSNKITSMGNSPTDTQYPSAKLVKDFVNSSINAYAAYYITKNAAGQPFATVEELDDATVYYSGGEVRTPTRNDYCIVLVDDVNGDGNSTRYLYNDGWEFQYVFNYQFTAGQIAALNSGVDATAVGQITTNTTAIATINASAPMTSGITSTKVGTYDGYATTIAGVRADLTELEGDVEDNTTAISGLQSSKQNTLNTTQMAAVNSGLSSTDKTKYDGYATSKANVADLSAVATSGSYTDLSDKPTIPVAGTDYLTPSAISSGYVAKDGSKVLSDVNFSTTYKSKLDGIAAGAEVNVQSDWTQTVSTADDYIKNKPTLATVATSGAYGDLSGKPTIPVSGTDFLSPTAISNGYVAKETGKGLTSNDFTSTYKTKLDGIAAGAEVNVQSNWTQTDTTADDFIKNKPTIPTNTNQLTNGAGFITSSGSITGSSGSCTGNAATATTATNYASSGGIATALSGKQATLVSGTNIKTVNGNSLLGSGNIIIQSGGVQDVTLNGTSIVSGGVANLTAADVRKIIISDQEPSGTAPDGTIWIQYEV